MQTMPRRKGVPDWIRMFKHGIVCVHSIEVVDKKHNGYEWKQTITVYETKDGKKMLTKNSFGVGFYQRLNPPAVTA